MTRAWIQLLQAIYYTPKSSYSWNDTVKPSLEDLRYEMGQRNDRFNSYHPEDAFEGAMSMLSALHCEWVKSEKICDCFESVEMGPVEEDNKQALQLLKKHENTHGSIISHATDFVECTVVMFFLVFCFFCFFCFFFLI